MYPASPPNDYSGSSGCAGVYAVKLSDTSAFVTLLAGRNVHTSPHALRYLDMLDLSPGEDLIRKCLNVWPHLDQLVKNRKRCILDETLECLRGGMRQVVILGSGIDTLSLEVASRAEGVTIYEMDTDNMDAKRRLLDEAAPDMAGRIRCVTADLGRPSEAAARAAEAGWRADVPSVLVLEGVSYYLGEQVLWESIRRFGAGSENQVILEYMVPSESIEPGRAHIPDDVFDTISEYLSDRLDIYRLSHDTVRKRTAELGGMVVRRHTMHTMEMHRTGTTRHFPTERSGWIEVSRMLTRPGETGTRGSP